MAMTGATPRRFLIWACLLCTAVGLGLGLAVGYGLWHTASGRVGGANAGPRKDFPPAPDDGLLVQVGLMQHVREVGKEYDVFYARPYASPPEVTVNTYPPEEYDLIEQRKDGFRIRFKVLAAEGERPSYRARGVPPKAGE
jgi:hypothetical protein